MSDEPQFDEETCVTAGELRARGVPLLDDIPDVAWVPRASIHFAPGEARPDPNDSTRFIMNFSWEFTEPFRWLSINFVVEPDEPTTGSR